MAPTLEPMINLARILIVLFVFVCPINSLAAEKNSLEDTQSIIILTSYAEQYVNPLEKAFREKYPNTRLRFLFKKTPAAVAHILNGRQPMPDIFMASAVDAFESLKKAGKLKRIASGKPNKLDNLFLDDKDGYYFGVALAGYGAMWNNDYLTRHNLTVPKDWNDLLKPEYSRHIAITSPMRSGTTHVIVETILQAYGWEKGWEYLLELAGNLSTITARSYGVRDGVVKGRFGIGLVVDFFALGAEKRGQPIDFAYYPNTTLMPASAAILAEASAPREAKTFIDFLISLEGQKLLAHKDIMRLPIRQDAYEVFPTDFPRPFDQSNFIDPVVFNKNLSSQRYQLVNSMFDQLITYRLRPLNRAWRLLHKLEASSSKLSDRLTIDKARKLLVSVPVGEMMSTEQTFLKQFSHSFPGTSKSILQTRLEQDWQDESERSFQKAMLLLHELELKNESGPEWQKSR
ncbi:ABC transporter substrate-binding protein [Kiloniella sp.]|uniref:ABC transporter substrate-binding protein n=1 Tax=Kiloniella sp. TaxID=1938587 RepID=UPI003A903816